MLAITGLFSYRFRIQILPYTRRLSASALCNKGFDITEASDGDEAIKLCQIVRLEAILLDIGMPGRNGIETCRELRHMLPAVAILMLSVTTDQERIAEALDAGADDYVTKPFQMRELTARLRSALRCLRSAFPATDEVISIGDVELHPARRLVFKAGKPVQLTRKEFALLHYLMEHAGFPVTYSRLLRAVWPSERAGQLDYLRPLVRQLRTKLEDDAGRPRYLLTESYVGYRFVDRADAVPRERSPF